MVISTASNVPKRSLVLLRKIGQTGFDRVAGFLKRVYGIPHPMLLSIQNYHGMAVLIVALDPHATSMAEIGRQVVIRGKNLWIVRPINDIESTIYFAAAMRSMGFRLPEIMFYKRDGKNFVLQEFVVGAMPCFTGKELVSLASTTLPAVLSAQGGGINWLNLHLKKYVTLGPNKIFVGLRQNERPLHINQVVWELLRARLIDPNKGIEQFNDGIRLIERLASGEFSGEATLRLAQAGVAKDQAERLIQQRADYWTNGLVPDLKKLLAESANLMPMVQRRLIEGETLTIRKERMVPVTYISPPDEAMGNKNRVEGKIAEAIRLKEAADVPKMVDRIISKGIKIVIVEGGSGRGKSSSLSELVMTLEGRGKRVALVHMDEIALKTAEERSPVKHVVAHAARYGFVVLNDEAKSTNPERVRDFIRQLAKLCSGEERAISVVRYESRSTDCRPTEGGEILLTDTPDTVFVLEGKFLSWPSYWEGISVPRYSVLLHVPQEMAEENIERFQIWGNDETWWADCLS